MDCLPSGIRNIVYHDDRKVTQEDYDAIGGVARKSHV